MDFGRYNSFWLNYYNAMDWRNKAQLEQWRCRARALEFENHILKEIIRQETQCGPNVSISSALPHYWPGEVFRNDVQDRGRERECEHLVDSGSEESELEFHVDEGMIAFYERSMRHKIEQKRLRQDREDEHQHVSDEENATLPPWDLSARRVRSDRSDQWADMSLLYGSAAPKIQGMETAVQLSFRRLCDKPSVRLWPNIPLRLK